MLKQIDSSKFDSVDIIVIDNNSTDNTKYEVEKFNSSKIKYIFEPNQGLSYARNSGYKAAKSEWVAYLDDDATAFPNWLDRIYWVITETDFDLFGGIYLPWYRDGKKKWYLDEYATNNTWMKYEKISELTIQNFSGGNCVFKKSILEEVGGFVGHLGMSGATVSYGEESYIQNKIRACGYKIGFDPEMLINHYVPLYKQTFPWFFVRAKALGKVFWEVNGITPSWHTIAVLTFAVPKSLIIDTRYCYRRLKRKEYKFANAYIYVGEKFIYQISKIMTGVKLKLL